MNNTVSNNAMTDSADKIMSNAAEEAKQKIKPKELSPDDFIKLFLAQLKNQNPEHPVDSSTILQQMSEISNIRSSKDMQETLKNLQQNMDKTFSKSQILQASQLIGKKVQAESDIGTLVPGVGMVGSVVVPAAASDVMVAIKNEKGETVRTIDCGEAKKAGPLDFVWDGRDQMGNVMPGKNYQLLASALINGKPIQVSTAVPVTVTSVASQQGTNDVLLNLEGNTSTTLDHVFKIY